MDSILPEAGGVVAGSIHLPDCSGPSWSTPRLPVGLVAAIIAVITIIAEVQTEANVSKIPWPRLLHAPSSGLRQSRSPHIHGSHGLEGNQMLAYPVV